MSESTNYPTRTLCYPHEWSEFDTDDGDACDGVNHGVYAGEVPCEATTVALVPLLVGWVLRKDPCPNCNGSGYSGTATIQDDEILSMLPNLCTTCFGCGGWPVLYRPCDTCKGTGADPDGCNCGVGPNGHNGIHERECGVCEWCYPNGGMVRVERQGDTG